MMARPTGTVNQAPEQIVWLLQPLEHGRGCALSDFYAGLKICVLPAHLPRRQPPVSNSRFRLAGNYVVELHACSISRR